MTLAYQQHEGNSGKKDSLASRIARILPLNASSTPLSVSNADRRLVQLTQELALAMPLLDAQANQQLHDEIDSLLQQFTAKTSEAEKNQLAHRILAGFEAYAHHAENTRHDQIVCWHETITMLFYSLLRLQSISLDHPAVIALLERIKHLSSSRDIQEWKNAVSSFLHPAQDPPEDAFSSALHATDTSSNNDNPFGLFGGGAAIEWLRTYMQEKRSGFIVFFHLFCLDVIRMRFGQEAVEDCLITVAANFTTSLQNKDRIYHWSDASLLAILQDRPSEIILNAELEHIVAQHRESTIKIAGRSIMIRLPITFEIYPIRRLRDPEDLFQTFGTATHHE